ncbi:MAG: cytochrome b [Hyphomicrobiales bacterium]|nr:cytochrome b [Hyphomicrobiales bacterium]
MSRSKGRSYGAIAMALHWTIAALFFGQILLGFSMERVRSMALQFDLIQWHKSFGFLILALAAVRLCWHLAVRGPRPAGGMTALERRAATFAQAALLAMTLVVPLAGWALASTSTLNIPSFAFNLVLIPHLPLAPSAQAEAFWRETHELLAYATLLLAAGHAAAALRHHFLLRDDVLGRMLPGLPGADEPGARAARPIRRTIDNA